MQRQHALVKPSRFRALLLERSPQLLRVSEPAERIEVQFDRYFCRWEFDLPASSGHVQHLKSISIDCDGDALLVEVDQVGAACHTGTRTCFTDRQIFGSQRSDVE